MRFKKQNSRKRLKIAIFKLLVLSYMHTTLYISFIRTILPRSMLCENTRKSLNLQYKYGFGTFQNIDFFTTFQIWGGGGGRVGKRLVKFCHPLQVANVSMLLAQNSLHYINIMTFESILGVFLFKTGMFQRIEN